jgi:hypothetical protein
MTKSGIFGKTVWILATCCISFLIQLFSPYRQPCGTGHHQRTKQWIAWIFGQGYN